MVISPVMRQTMSIAWPLLINAVLHQSMVLIDTLLVSPLGSMSVAALGLSSTFVFFSLGVQFAFASGTQLILARCYGAQNEQATSQQFLAGQVINLSVTVLFSLTLFFFPLSALHGLIDDPEVVSLTAVYLKISALTLVFASLSQVTIARLNAARLTRIPMFGLGIEIPVNLVTSWVLIHGFPFGYSGMGMVGAAWGSLVAMCVRTLYLHLRAKPLFYKMPGTSSNRLPIKLLWAHLSEAGPIALNYLTLISGIMTYQLLFAQLPVAEYAAIVLLLPWIRVGGQVGTTWGQAVSIQISRMIGENNVSALKQLVCESLKFSALLSVMVAMCFTVFIFCIPLIYGHLDTQTMSTLVWISPWFVLLPLVRIFNTVQGQTLRAMRQSSFVLLVHAVTLWVLAIPLCAFFVWLDLSVFWVFSLLVFEEALKTVPFLFRLCQRLTLMK